VPVKLTGALDAPQWSIDFAGMATGIARETLQREVLDRAFGGSGDPAATGKKESGKPASVEERLRGIFGR
jgi:hypothetical protein